MAKEESKTTPLREIRKKFEYYWVWFSGTHHWVMCHTLLENEGKWFYGGQHAFRFSEYDDVPAIGVKKPEDYKS